ncbi:hypothetical protein BDC45DRAFT_147031 [Circinella umbellata]|nr:hypothetical protein BDC45DRAFT_147031 [Circinella umbellata]
MNDILYLIKTLHALLSRHMTHAQPIFAKIQNAQENDPDAQLVAKLLGVLSTICTDADVYARDCSQLAGMAIASISLLSVLVRTCSFSFYICGLMVIMVMDIQCSYYLYLLLGENESHKLHPIGTTGNALYHRLYQPLDILPACSPI